MSGFAIYWLLRIFTFLTLLICGFLISYKDPKQKKFWLYGSIAGVVYSLNYGLRWNRPWDYPHYYQDLTGRLYTNYSDITYLAWIDFFKFSGLPYWVAFIFYSAILFYGFLLIIRKYPKGAVWALPLFFTFPTNVDNFIRQFFATSFLFIGYYFMEEKKWGKTLLFFLLCLTIHFSGLFAIFIFLFFYFFKISEKFVNAWLLIAIFLGFFFFWDVAYLDPLGSLVSKIDTGAIGDVGGRSSYIEGAEYWLTQEGDINTRLGNYNIKASSVLYNIFTCITPVVIIYLGTKTLKSFNQIRVIFWSSYLANIIKIIGGNIEIYSRFYCWLVCFEPVLVGIIMYKVPMKPYLKWSVVGLFVIYFYYYNFLSYFKAISELGYDFVWDR